MHQLFCLYRSWVSFSVFVMIGLAPTKSLVSAADVQGPKTAARNEPPRITGFNGRVFKTGDPVGPLTFQVSDLETDASALTVTAVSSNPALVPLENIHLAGSGSTRTVSVIPAPGQKGIASVTIRVTDAGGTAASSVFGVWVLDSRVARTKFSAGQSHTVLVRPEGGLWTWGENEFGQLGDGTFKTRTFPLRVDSSTHWTDVDAGGLHTVAIKSNGTLWAWGANSYGQLGDGTFETKTVPIQIGQDTNWVTVAAGEFRTMAMKSNGTLWAWGSNLQGELGLGPAFARQTRINAPTQIGTADNWLAVAAGGTGIGGGYFTTALRSDGTLWTWGTNDRGQLGDGTMTGRSLPARLGQASDWVAVAAGGFHSLALKSDGTLWGWGLNSFGQSADPNKNVANAEPTRIGLASDWVEVAAGVYHTLALKADGTLWAWGDNSTGQLGLGGFSPTTEPIQVPGPSDWVALAVARGGVAHNLGASSHTAALKADGSLWTWGRNASGLLGDGIWGDAVITPKQVGQAADWKAVATGDSHTVGLKSNGTLWKWGEEQIPDVHLPRPAAFGVTNAPVRAGLETNFVALDAGDIHTVALRADGTLWTWGFNLGGQLGYWTSPRHCHCSPNPRLVEGSNWGSVAAGGSETFAIKPDGTLWRIHSQGPIQIDPANDWKSVSIGGRSEFHASLNRAALKADGSLWAWKGSNAPGDHNPVPQRVAPATDWIAVSAGAAHSLALKSNGTLWAWGANESGQLGDGTLVARGAPVQVGSTTNWMAVSAGGSHSLALKSDRSLWAWGGNSFGQLGDGTFRPRHVPLRIGRAADWGQITAGQWHSLAIKTDGTLWTWGNDSADMLGDGTTVNPTSPQFLLNVLDEAPEIFPISSQFTSQNLAAGPVQFRVRDPDTPLDDLILTAESSDGAVVQPYGIAISGLGAQRTMTLTPVPDGSGATRITLRVTDGSLYAQTAFDLIVLPRSQTPLPPGSARLDLVRARGDGPFGLNLQGEPGRRFKIEVSEDLQTWSLLREAALTNDVWWIVDIEGRQKPRRFYRAQLVP